MSPKARQLKIAMLSVHSCPLGSPGSRDTGGMNVYVREVALELGRLGHAVDIYTRYHDPRDPQVVELGERTRLIHLQAGEVESIHKLVLYSYLADFACNMESFRRQNGLGYDVIHSHYWLSGWIAKHVQGWWNVPHVTMFHTLGAAKNAVGIGEDDPELRIETEKDVAVSCQRVVAATQRERDCLVIDYGASPEAISVIPCGVNLGVFRPVDRQMARRHLGFNGGSIALFVGRIEPLKGVDRLLQAMTYLNKAAGVRLVVVGGDEQSQSEVQRLRNLARELHIQDSVTFAGMVLQEELPYYYSAADVCVIPSHYESFGLVALESLACGTPVVATRVGGTETVVQQHRTGYVVDNAPLQLADKIARIVSNSDKRRLNAAETRATVSGFSWANTAEAIVQEYRALLRAWGG